MALPMIRFQGGPEDGKLHGWTGPWPPPERMGVAVGRQSRELVHFDEETLEKQGVALEEVERVAEITWYERQSFSKLPETVDALSHVARGALYVAAA
jgi:hypothetical protein